MISEKELIKLSQASKKARYFVIMYAANNTKYSPYKGIETGYLHGEIVHISKCGNYPIRKHLVNKIQRVDRVYNVSITNIIELSRTDFKTWVKNC